MRVIGTAGHVDHGKSSLIEALTGTHPDRLKEEQAREMTIDLGFGWLTLPDGEEVGIVDVPGHRDFIENMLAGIAGIDAVLLVVAADEGIMPQTREHIAILDLLQIPAGVIVLTKTDLVADEAWLGAVESDVHRVLEGTVLEDSPTVRVSARTGSGLSDLLVILNRVLNARPERPDLRRPRLPIDRVFTMSGFGTVVTGTLSEGQLTTGDEVEFLPSGLRSRIRGLQTHRKSVERVMPGSRAAVNLSGTGTEQLRRGEVLTHPGTYQTTRRVDARLRVLADASDHIRHNREVKVFMGSSETLATLRLLGVEELMPGQQGWVQLELQHPIVCVRGDAFVLRRPSPAETLGGGTIVEEHPDGRHKRFDQRVLASLQAIAEGDPADLVFAAAMDLHVAAVRAIVSRSQLTSAVAESALRKLLRAGRLIVIENGTVDSESDLLAMALPQWNKLEDQIDRIVSEHHKRFPLRRGIPREELKSQLGLSTRIFNLVIERRVSDGTLIEAQNSIAMAGYQIQFNDSQRHRVEALIRQFKQSPFSPPALKDCKASAGEEVVNALIELGELVAVSGDVIFRKPDYDFMVDGVQARLAANGQVTLAEVRDLFGTSRKYAQAFLEYLDRKGITRRSGDARVLAS
jgi:selenocysteine-specific elongation factor